MAATLQQHCATATTTPLTSAASTSPNPKLKRLVYSKYRELLGSYNDQANAYIDTLPSYMVHKDNGFNLEPPPTINHTANATATIHLTSPPGANEMYGSGQRMPAQSTYEAPACVQNAMTRDKKPFTYTPGGIDLSQIKSERMAKRLARNACAEGASGQSQQNRPSMQPMSPSSPGGAAASMGAAAMGMPFQVLPPTPHHQTAAGKNTNGGCAPAPPPPPPSSSNFLNTGSLAPQMNGVNGGRGSAPNSPNMPRKIPAPPPQRFEPPPLGFRPEIKIPTNPMAALRKVPPPVEKNTFWKDEYKKNSTGSEDTPRVAAAAVAPISSYSYTEENDSVNGSSSTTPQTNASNGTDQITTNGETTNIKSNNSDNIDGFKKTMPTTTTNKIQQNQTNNLTNTQEQEAIKTPPTSSSSSPPTPMKPSQDLEKPQYLKSPTTSSPDTQSLSSITRPTPPTSPQNQSALKPISPPLAQQKQVGRESATPPTVASPPKPATPPQTHQIQIEAQQKQQSPKPEFRSVAAASPQAAVNVFTRQTDSPRSVENATPPRVTESPFRQAQPQQQRAPVNISPLAQQQMTPSSASSGASISPNPQAQAVPWRTQRGQTPQQQAAPAAQSHPQPFYNNVQQQQQQQTQRPADFNTQSAAYPGPKPTNVGSLYIAPLAAPTEPQAQHIVRQQMQQQQAQRDSPMRQMAAQPQSQTPNQQQLRWMSSQPKPADQPAWVRPEENGNVVPSSLNRIKSPPPSSFQSQPQQQAQPQPQQQYQPQPFNQQPQPFNQGNGFMINTPVAQNFGAQHNAPAGLRLQINTKSIQNNNTNNQSGPRERIIPIQLEQTPTYTPAQPSFNTPSSYGAGTASSGYVMRTPNQFVDQGYNNYGAQSTPQRVMSPPMQEQQLNAPRMVQQQLQNNGGNTRTHIVPIAMENNSEGTRGPISKTPIVIQNDLRTPPIQSKSFRILQKITDTIDDANNDDSGNQQRNDNYMDAEPQLQRPTFARQMSAQQARNSPTVEQMRRMKIGYEQGNSTPQTPSQFNQPPRPFYNNNNDYVPPSEQHVPEPKKYTGSAIPSRSFKILQAMTQPENAGEQDNSLEYNDDTNDETKSEHNNESCTTSSSTEPVSSSSMSPFSSTDSICSGPTPPPSQPLAYPSYPYPYGYPWYPPPCPMPSPSNGDSANTPNWPYPYAMPPPPSQGNGDSANPANWHYPYPMPPPAPTAANGDNTQLPPFPPYPYYYPYPYPMPPFPSHSQSTEFDSQNMYAPYLPPPPPYHAYPYPVAPSYSQTSSSSRASSVLPDIIITPSTEDVPSQVILQHHINIEKEKSPKRFGSVDIEDVTTVKTNHVPEGSIVDILTQHLQNMSQSVENNLNSSRSTKKSYKKNFDQKSPDDNTSPVQITMVMTETEHDSDTESSDSDATTKQFDMRNGKDGSVPLQSIRSVTNIQIYNGLKHHQVQDESDDDEDDDTTADGESDVFDEEGEEDFEYEHSEEQDSECEEYIVEDNLSVIYEEESDFDKSCEMGKPLRRSEHVDELEKCIEENDDDEDIDKDNEEEKYDSNTVTVRLPLKFSFTKSSNHQPITTVEVGTSLVEDRRHSLTLSEKHNAFSVATVDSDSETEDSDSCDVSVTISLSRSSRSGSVDSKESELKHMSEKYPIEDMPLPEKALPKIDTSQEDVSFSFSLNKRNKFVGQTLKGDLTNNIAQIEEAEDKSNKNEMVQLKQSTEELDFFATLMATKIQAQKIKEQSASYWGKSAEKKEPKEEESIKIEDSSVEVQVEEGEKNESEAKTDTDDLNVRTNFWAKYSTNNTETISEVQPEVSNNYNTSKEPEEIEDIWAKREDAPIVQKKGQQSYWDTYFKSTIQNEAEIQTEAKAKTIASEEIEDIWANRDEEDIPVRKSSDSYNHIEQPTAVQQTDEVADIWVDRKEDLPAVKNLSKKLDSLETAKNSFWSTVAEANKTSEETHKQDINFWSELKLPKQKPKQETIMEIAYSPAVLSYRIDELSQSLKPLIHIEEESQHIIEAEVPEEEVDFWAQLEESQPEPRQDITQVSYDSFYANEELESSFWNDDNISDGQQQNQEYDPLKYPEEPREVDTDEEIDFWAEIEAKRLQDDDDVTFHRAATFWASRDRNNSVDETPYQQVLPKAFAAKMPDELPTQDLNVWATLEAHKGEEPVLVDPVVEEENVLAQEFDDMSREQEAYEDNTSSMLDVASVHEPIVASVWSTSQREEDPITMNIDEPIVAPVWSPPHWEEEPLTKNIEEPIDAPVWSQPQWEEETISNNVEEPDFWAEIEKNTSGSSEKEKSEPEKDDVEAKRNNYRKAMAFFTTSIDDHKEDTNERPERSNESMNRNSYIEDETEKWDCSAVNETLEQEQQVLSPKPEIEKKAKKPPKKETKSKSKSKSPKGKFKEAMPTATSPELPEVYVEPTLDLKRLPNGLPDLEVNKFKEERKVSVRDRISVFETGSFEVPDSRRNSITNQSLSVDSSTTRQSSLSRNSSSQRSESEVEEDDSGVTDMNKLSETETESDSFPELRKMSSYQRAATHSRLFKLLQDDPEGLEDNNGENHVDEFQLRPSRRKVVHNVSITRKQNPKALTDVETMSQRRERLSLPLRKNTSIDADNPSTPNSPASPIMDQSANQCVVSDKLVSELVQSLLLKSDSTHLRKLPMEKLQAAAKRVLEEELDSLENTSVDSTPAMTPNELKKDKSYADYYNTWSDANGSGDEVMPSKSFKVLQDSPRRSPWTARCPRVLSSKTINRDLARVTESPEIFMRNSKSPECFRQSRESSVSKWRKV